MFGWVWKSEPKHVAYVPAHRLAVPLVNPNDGHPGFFMVMPLEVIHAAAYGRAMPERVVTTIIHESRN